MRYSFLIETEKDFKLNRIPFYGVLGFRVMLSDPNLEGSYDMWIIESESLDESDLRKVPKIRRAAFITYVDTPPKKDEKLDREGFLKRLFTFRRKK